MVVRCDVKTELVHHKNMIELIFELRKFRNMVTEIYFFCQI